MLHDHRAFDRADPETKAAIATIAPTVEKLLAERAKPEPHNADDHYAWSAYIIELEDEVGRAAADVGLSPADLIAEAERALRRRPGARAAPAPIAAEPMPDPAVQRRKDAETAAVANIRISGEMLENNRQILALLKRQKVLAREHAATCRILFVGRGRG